MVIIAGHVDVDASDRDRYVAAHQDLVERARRAPGCMDVAISADPLDPTRVNTFERWASIEHLDAWRAVADAPDTGITIRNDDVMMYVVDDARPPFAGPHSVSCGAPPPGTRPRRR
jgi:quinol monooxygenase YgiN